jgi:hypothetical protein
MEVTLKKESLPLEKNTLTAQGRNNAFGLKEISNRVKDIIKQSGQTTYKEVSDRIVNEINQKGTKDEKNIRRRIYDSLNVMKSMKLFRKDRVTKKIKWNYFDDIDIPKVIKGKEILLDEEVPEINEMTKEMEKIKNEYEQLYEKIYIKKQKYSTLKKELKYLKEILLRNKKKKVEERKKIYFPFIIIEFPTDENNSDSEGKVKVSMNENQSKVHFGFDSANKLYGDLDAVAAIGSNINFNL